MKNILRVSDSSCCPVVAAFICSSTLAGMSRIDMIRLDNTTLIPSFTSWLGRVACSLRKPCPISWHVCCRWQERLNSQRTLKPVLPCLEGRCSALLIVLKLDGKVAQTVSCFLFHQIRFGCHCADYKVCVFGQTVLCPLEAHRLCLSHGRLFLASFLRNATG